MQLQQATKQVNVYFTFDLNLNRRTNSYNGMICCFISYQERPSDICSISSQMRLINVVLKPNSARWWRKAIWNEPCEEETRKWALNCNSLSPKSNWARRFLPFANKFKYAIKVMCFVPPTRQQLKHSTVTTNRSLSFDKTLVFVSKCHVTQTVYLHVCWLQPFWRIIFWSFNFTLRQERTMNFKFMKLAEIGLLDETSSCNIDGVYLVSKIVTWTLYLCFCGKWKPFNWRKIVNA